MTVLELRYFSVTLQREMYQLCPGKANQKVLIKFELEYQILNLCYETYFFSWNIC